jgi:hypothetical protein
MVAMRGVVVATCLLAACFSPSPQAGAPCSGVNHDCPDGLECSARNTCEKPGTMFEPDACADATCDGDTLIACGQPTTCAYGCAATTTAHCLQLAPSNGITLDLLDGATADVSNADIDFDADTGLMTITDANNVLVATVRPAGPGVINGIRFEVRDGMGIFVANSWTFTASSEDTDGAGTNSFVLFARTTITVAAVLDAGANGTGGGPDASSRNSSINSGGCRGRAGRSNSGIGATFGEGGGGGGGVTTGGDGAPSNQAGATGIGGTSCSSPDTIPLRGGNAGGDGGQSASNGGGGGGGAMMLVAMESITVASGGAVASPGGGGLSGTGAAGNGGGGGGGGGAVLLEAPVVNLMGAITANGGGGGAPAGGTDGVRGTVASRATAAGGSFSCVPTPGATPVTVRGGAGGAGSTAAADGATCTTQDAAAVVVSSQGAGGGGAPGRTHIRRHAGTGTGTQSPTAMIEDVAFQ